MNTKMLTPLITVCIAAVAVCGIVKARSGLRRSPLFWQDANSVRWDSGSRNWPTDRVLNEVASHLPLGETVSTFEHEPLTAVERGLTQSPWVERVLSVERRFPFGIGFSVEVRCPVAAVNCRNRLYLTDSSCVRLPGSFSPAADIGVNVPTITGVSENVRPPAPGDCWQSAAVTDGIAVCSLFASKLPEVMIVKDDGFSLASVDVARYHSGGAIVLNTTDRLQFEWGRAEGGRKICCLNSAQKLQNLRILLHARRSCKEGDCYILWAGPLIAYRGEASSQ